MFKILFLWSDFNLTWKLSHKLVLNYIASQILFEDFVGFICLVVAFDDVIVDFFLFLFH